MPRLLEHHRDDDSLSSVNSISNSCAYVISVVSSLDHASLVFVDSLLSLKVDDVPTILDNVILLDSGHDPRTDSLGVYFVSLPPSNSAFIHVINSTILLSFYSFNCIHLSPQHIIKVFHGFAVHLHSRLQDHL